MVNGGFLDIEAALSALRKSDSLKAGGFGSAEHVLLPLSSSAKVTEYLIALSFTSAANVGICYVLQRMEKLG